MTECNPIQRSPRDFHTEARNVTTKVYMPLRSNAAWFGDTEVNARLERQVKANLILYDRLILQDGRYQIIAGPDGQGMQMWLPGNSFPNRTQIQYFSPGGGFGIQVGEMPLLSSNCDVGYSVDFLPIIHRAGIEGEAFLEWVNQDVSPEVASEISSHAGTEIIHDEFASALPKNKFIARHLLEGLYRDAVVAHSFGAPFSVDFHAERLIGLQLEQAIQAWSIDLAPAFFRYWLNLQLPDLSELGWQELCEFRESDAGRSFREMVHRISSRVKEALPEVKNQAEVDQWISREFNKDVLAELSARVAGPIQTIVSVCCNFIPYGSIPSVAKTLSDWGRDQESWVSLVKGFKPN